MGRLEPFGGAGEIFHSGDPNGGDAPNWPTYGESSDTDLVLDLPPNTTTETGLRKEKCDFWASVTPP